jgi:hypothetical protein
MCGDLYSSLLGIAINALVSVVAGAAAAIWGVNYGYKLSIRHESDMRKRAFRTLLRTVAENLKAANDGNVFYIHSESLAAVTSGCDALLEYLTDEKATKLRTLRVQYAQLQNKARAQKDAAMMDSDKQSVRGKRDEMVDVLTEMLACAK